MNRRSAGFGLLEILVTLAITSLVLVVFFGTLFRSQNVTRRFTEVVETRQGARAAIQLIEREIRMAGSGWGRLAVEGCNAGAPLTLRAIGPGYGGPAGNDSLQILGGWDATTALRAAMASPTSLIKVASTAGFAAGDLCVVTNGASAHLFQVTQIQSPPGDLAHEPSSPFNVSGGHASWPVGGYGTGANVYKVSWISYAVDSASGARPMLMRRGAGQAPQVVAAGIESFQVGYRLHDGTTTRDPTNLAMIDRVIPMLRGHTRGPNGTTSIDSLWATVHPRTF